MTVILTLTRALAMLMWSSTLLDHVQGHGRLWEPPGRATMWRRELDNPVDNNDNYLNCGGKINQWYEQGGRCGICGDPYQGPRPHEVGGIYANGIITRTYRQGQVVDATVDITANHLGWFEFRLCPNNDIHREATQECLDRHVLQLAGGSGSRLNIGTAYGAINVKLRLPPDVTCTQCVFQWKYHTANSPSNCLDCPNQEEFYGCSDVSIVANSDVSNSVTDNKDFVPTYQPPTTKRSAPIYAQLPDLFLPPLGGNDVDGNGSPTATTAPEAVIRTSSGTAQPIGGPLGQAGGPPNCASARFRWPGHALHDLWCQSSCLAGNQCPQNFCIC